MPIVLIFILAAGYYFLMVIIAWTVKHLKSRSACTDLTISVVVAARNEEAVIADLLDSLAQCDYPTERWEVILVDDDSTDATRAIMQNYAARFANWRMLHHSKSPESPRGKKGALTLGISQARGEIVLTTDADCRVPPTWIKSMVGYFSPEVGMVLGNSPVEPARGFFPMLQQFDSVCEATTAAVSAFYNRPSHSNGRNLAFRKVAFEEVGGYSESARLSSGDDFFLSRQIQMRTSWKFAYNIDSTSFVTTRVTPLGRRFIHQQLRRNGKAFYLTPLHFLIAAWIFLFHLSLVISLFISIKMLLALLMLKFVFEYHAFQRGAHLFKQTHLLPYFPVFWVVYPLFIIGFAVLGTLQKYGWK